MVGVGRDLCGSSSPTLLPKQGHLQQAVEDLVQAGKKKQTRTSSKQAQQKNTHIGHGGCQELLGLSREGVLDLLLERAFFSFFKRSRKTSSFTRMRAVNIRSELLLLSKDFVQKHATRSYSNHQSESRMRRCH